MSKGQCLTADRHDHQGSGLAASLSDLAPATKSQASLPVRGSHSLQTLLCRISACLAIQLLPKVGHVTAISTLNGNEKHIKKHSARAKWLITRAKESPAGGLGGGEGGGGGRIFLGAGSWKNRVECDVYLEHEKHWQVGSVVLKAVGVVSEDGLQSRAPEGTAQPPVNPIK